MGHRSDCAVHNEPAFPNKECNCWWLVNGETIQKITEALQSSTHEINDHNCEDWPPGSGCNGCRGDEERKNALHWLESGCHLTKEIPADYQTGG